MLDEKEKPVCNLKPETCGYSEGVDCPEGFIGINCNKPGFSGCVNE